MPIGGDGRRHSVVEMLQAHLASATPLEGGVGEGFATAFGISKPLTEGELARSYLGMLEDLGVRAASAVDGWSPDATHI